MLTRPSWIGFDEADKRRLRFIWDDTRVPKDFAGDAAPALRAAMQMSLRARMVLSVGLYEWIVWRFDGLHSRVEPLQIAQAAWCAAVDPRYLRFFELTREEWRGPIDGPLWCAATWLQPAMSDGHRFPRNVYDAISFLLRLAIHVVPERERFEDWLTVVLARLVADFPLVADDPFGDLLDRRVGERLGPLIGRNVLDPSVRYDLDLGRTFLALTLRDAVVEGNPFLSAPGDLKDLNFVGEPYVLPV